MGSSHDGLRKRGGTICPTTSRRHGRLGTKAQNGLTSPLVPRGTTLWPGGSQGDRARRHLDRHAVRAGPDVLRLQVAMHDARFVRGVDGSGCLLEQMKETEELLDVAQKISLSCGMKEQEIICPSRSSSIGLKTSI